MLKSSLCWSLLVAALYMTVGTGDAEARCWRRCRSACNAGCGYQSTGYQNSACCGAQGTSYAPNGTMNSNAPANNQAPAPPPVETAPAPRT